MEPIPVSIRKIGNSQGFVVPKAMLAQLGLDASISAEMTIEHDALVVRRPKVIRKGWAEASKRIAVAGDDALVFGEFGNSADDDFVW